MDKANVLGVHIALVTLNELFGIIREVISSGKRIFITHVNVTGLNIAYEQEWYRRVLNNSDLVYCDGMGVQLGGRLLGYNIPERFTLADWMWPFAEVVERDGSTFFFLGNPPGVAQKATERLRERYPKLSVVGAHDGFFDKTPGHPENEAVIQKINNVKPDILLVGFGMPVQEKWVSENWRYLEVNVVITVGAIFEYISGDLKRGPEWMTQHYLEWLARIIISPERYWQRYFRDNPKFMLRILKQRFTGRLA